MTDFLKNISTPERIVEIPMVSGSNCQIQAKEISEMSFQKMEYLSSLTPIEILENEKLIKTASEMYGLIEKVRLNESSEWVPFSIISAPDKLKWLRILVTGSLSLLEEAKKK
jgi:hypothetical protein